MTFSEPYMFVLAISAVLSIPLVLAIRNYSPQRSCRSYASASRRVTP